MRLGSLYYSLMTMCALQYHGLYETSDRDFRETMRLRGRETL